MPHGLVFRCRSFAALRMTQPSMRDSSIVNLDIAARQERHRRRRRGCIQPVVVNDLTRGLIDDSDSEEVPARAFAWVAVDHRNLERIITLAIDLARPSKPRRVAAGD